MYNKFASSTATSCIVSDAMYSMGINHQIQWEDGNHTGVMLTFETAEADVEALYVLISTAGEFHALEIDNKLIYAGDRKSVTDALSTYIYKLYSPWS